MCSHAQGKIVIGTQNSEILEIEEKTGKLQVKNNAHLSILIVNYSVYFIGNFYQPQYTNSSLTMLLCLALFPKTGVAGSTWDPLGPPGSNKKIFTP